MTLKVIWKRPDGFHNASPEDYRIVQLESGAKLWLHRENVDWYPFRVSGGWADEELTRKLNRLTNLLDHDDEKFVSMLTDDFFNSEAGEADQYAAELLSFISKVSENLKGDTWEVDIMSEAIEMLQSKIEGVKHTFITRTKN